MKTFKEFINEKKKYEDAWWNRTIVNYPSNSKELDNFLKDIDLRNIKINSPAFVENTDPREPNGIFLVFEVVFNKSITEQYKKELIKNFKSLPGFEKNYLWMIHIGLILKNLKECFQFFKGDIMKRFKLFN